MCTIRRNAFIAFPRAAETLEIYTHLSRFYIKDGRGQGSVIMKSFMFVTAAEIFNFSENQGKA